MLTFDDALSQAKAAFSPDTAIDYIKGRYQAFRALGPLLVDMEHQASVLSQQARAAGDYAAAERLKQRIYDIGTLATLQQNTMNKMDEILSFAGVDTSQLGALPLIPIAAIATATAVVAVMLYLAFHISDQRRALDLEAQALAMVQSGKLTPAQAQSYVNAANAAAQASASSGFGAQLGKGVFAVGALVALIYFAPSIFPRLKGGKL